MRNPCGGTSIGCLDFSKYNGDEILLFSDGISNFASSEPKFSTKPIYTFNSNLTANALFLKYIAQQSGGQFFDMTTLKNDEIVSQLSKSNYHFISSSVENGLISSQYPSIPSPFVNSFGITGKMCGKSATLLLNFGFGSTITYTKKVVINADHSGDADILRRLWAEKKIAELSMNESEHKNEITLMGKKFGIVSPNTSLIVLENLNDYITNDIVPPIEMQAEFYKRKLDVKNESNYRIKHHLNWIVELSNKQTSWWNTTYPIIFSKPRTKFTAPVITRDEEVRESDDLKSQDALSRSNTTISIADVKGNNESSGEIIEEVRVAVTQVAEHQQSYDGHKNAVVQQSSSIQINAWDPQTPYLKVLQYAAAGSEYITYQKLKIEYGATPSFYIDVADFFAKAGKKDTAEVILSNLAELKLESPQLLRVLGNKLLEYNFNTAAVFVFEKVLILKGDEPQSYRDLGLAYKANGKYQLAINTLYNVLNKDWDFRFEGIELIALNEINNIISLHPNLNYSFIDKRLIKNEPVDIRVVLTWDTDNCDMDLWVSDPTNDRCSYQNSHTKFGGKISNDMVNGYGLEEFMIKHASNGQYSIQANYYGTRAQTLLVPVNLHVVFFTNYGMPNQKKQEVTIRLDNQNDIIDIGKFSFNNGK